MRILHLATSLTNGAGKAARRINEMNNLLGLDSQIVTSGRVDGNLSAVEMQIQPTILKKSLSKIVTVLQEKSINNSSFPLTPVSIQSLNLKRLNLEDFDIVNIHATYNLLSFNSVRKILQNNIHVVVTLHDERPYTGGCHNTMSCTRFKVDCKKCPSASLIGKQVIQKSFKLERHELLKRQRKISVLAPSDWIKGQASNSAKFENLEITKISNPVPETIYMHEDRLQHPQTEDSQITLGFIAANLDNPFKGLSLLFEALELMDELEKKRYRLFLIGNKTKITEFPISTKQFEINDDAEVAILLRSIDLLIVPSVGDNSPSVISESQMCGTKVIGSNRGGIPEMLGYDSELIFDITSPITILEKIRLNSVAYNRKSLSTDARGRYSYLSIGRLYKQFYEGIIC